MAATRRLRDSVYMSPQLVQLTNTLRRPPPPPGSQGKKICQAGSHNASDTCGQNQTQQLTHQGVNDSTMLPEKEVVFRAVSPHGHVYWEIDPTRGMNFVLQSCTKPTSANNKVHEPKGSSIQKELISVRLRTDFNRFSLKDNLKLNNHHKRLFVCRCDRW